MGRFNDGPLEGQQWVGYLDLAGGRNTKKDPHALNRNELFVSDNTWSAQGNTLQKRPGSISIPNISVGKFGAISAGNVGSGLGAKTMVAGRFFNQTAFVVQSTGNQLYAAPRALPAVSVGVPTWISIGAISGGSIAAAQLFDPDPTNPNGPDGTLFVVNGVDTPKLWGGPGNVLRPAVTAQLPTKQGTNKPITPAYVATLFSSVFYAGEPTEPSAVYVSDPFRPQQFNVNALIPTGTITTSTYIPYFIGRGDGIGGGAVTGLAPMGSAMIVYKQSAIYAMTQLGLQGDMVWGSAVASSSVGCTSPKSIVAFDTFHVFLGIDGVYTFDGSGTRKVSENNPDLFDGPTAAITDRTSAVGVRQGNLYLLFFDNASAGYANAGAWFDFGKRDEAGLPLVGTISGMNVGGVVSLRGPNDLGNWAWADAASDRVGLFGGTVGTAQVNSDFGTAYVVSVTGKADLFADVWGDEAPEDAKVVDSVHLVMSFPIVSAGQQYTFNGTATFDQQNAVGGSGTTSTLPAPGTAVVGTGVVGSAVVGIVAGTPAYQHVPLYLAAPATGYIIQFGFTETSAYPWTTLGYILLVNRQQRTGVASG